MIKTKKDVGIFMRKVAKKSMKIDNTMYVFNGFLFEISREHEMTDFYNAQDFEDYIWENKKEINRNIK